MCQEGKHHAITYRAMLNARAEQAARDERKHSPISVRELLLSEVLVSRSLQV